MEKVRLGRTELQVSPICYGTWQFGGDWGPVDEAAAFDAIRHARGRGITFFDTAQGYGFGTAERILGRALRAMAWTMWWSRARAACDPTRAPRRPRAPLPCAR
jgi:aryl-alcohol dehydrogenase-like predicted oxidoreductase